MDEREIAVGEQPGDLVVREGEPGRGQRSPVVGEIDELRAYGSHVGVGLEKFELKPQSAWRAEIIRVHSCHVWRGA